MKCDLAGLLTNAISSLRGRTDEEMTDYYMESIKEVVHHIHCVRDGSATAEEFCNQYLIGYHMGSSK